MWIKPFIHNENDYWIIIEENEFFQLLKLENFIQEEKKSFLSLKNITQTITNTLEKFSYNEINETKKQEIPFRIILKT